MAKATPAAKARHLQTKQRQLAKLSAEIKAMEEDKTDAEGDDEEAEAESEEDKAAAETSDTTDKVEGEEDESYAEGEEEKTDAEDEDEKVEARVALFKSLPEAKGQQNLAATLARQGKTKAEAKTLLAAAAKDARLEARKDHGVPRAGGGSAASGLHSKTSAAGARLIAVAKTHRVPAR